MPCFSCTAPVITEAEELAERESLTPEERIEITRDLFGCDNDDDDDEVQRETPQMIQNGLAMLHSAIESSIPANQKVAYLEALKRVPHLVQRESNPVAFLRAENYNAWAAAKRLVQHWKLRQKIFGPTRAFLPMTLDGAMADNNNDDDEGVGGTGGVRQILEQGPIQLLPNDQHGRAVLFFDRIRCGDLNMDRIAIHRCFFYLLCVLGQQQQSADEANNQRRGFVWVVNLKCLDLYKHFDRLLMKGNVDLFKYAPVRWRSTHICTGARKSVVSILLPIFRQLLGKYYRMRLIVHMGNNADIIAGFQVYGLLKEDLNHAVGGLRQNDEAAMWVQRRRRIEQQPR